MTHVSHIDSINVNEDIAFLEVFATWSIQDGLHLLAVGAIGDGEPETHSTFGNLHRKEFHLVVGCRISIDSIVSIFITCSNTQSR